MKSTINALITFLDSDNADWMYQSDLKKANEKMAKYSEEYLKLMSNKERRNEEQKATSDLEELTRETRKLVAIAILGSAIRGEQSYHFENKKFTDSKSEVYLGDFNDEHYQIEIKEADSNKAIIVANPKQKDSNLKSYAEAIAYDESSYQYERISCETDKPSTSINLPTLSSNKWSCGTDSIESE